MAVTGYDNYSYRWRTGFVTAAALTTLYEITNTTTFPLFADMGGLSEWALPGGTKWYNEGVLAEKQLSSRSTFLGKPWFQWPMPAVTAQQLDFLLYDATYFNGAASMDSTVSTWNSTRNRWEVVQVISSRDIISSAAEPGYGIGAAAGLVITHVVEQDAP
ncbi:MAG: hypothetical protein ACYTEQ_23095 [Planctomycetota bacterium]|jgi:hypothetical protein